MPEIPRIDKPTPEEFAQHCKLDGTPVILTGVVEDWPAFKKWDADYLCQTAGSAKVRFKVSHDSVHPDFESEEPAPRETGTLEEYIRRITSGDPDERARCFLSGDEQYLDHADPNLVSPDLTPLHPDLPECRYFSRERLQWAGLWLSAAGVRSAMHFDGNGAHNLNAQIRGSKKAWLYPPEEPARLYPYMALSADRAPCWFARPDPTGEVAEERYPEFQNATCWHTELVAGELLFIPAFWYHSFQHVGAFNVNVNYWWSPDRLDLHPTSVRWAFLVTLQRLFGDQLEGVGPEAKQRLAQVEQALVNWRPL